MNHAGDIIAGSSLLYGSERGLVRVFKYQSGSWLQLGDVIQGQYSGDHCGHAIDLSSDGYTIIVGSNFNDGNGSSSGCVRVFEYSSGSWQQVGPTLYGAGSSSQFGSSAAISSDAQHIAVGAPFTTGVGGTVKVFERVGNNWVQQGNTITGYAPGDLFGASVDINDAGNKIVVGATGTDVNGTSSGQIRAFELISGSWVQVGPDINGSGMTSRFGSEVSISASGDTISGGGPEDSYAGFQSGQTATYKRVGLTWQLLGEPIYGAAADDRCGRSLQLTPSGSGIVTGSWHNSTVPYISGHVRVYEFCPQTDSNLYVKACDSYSFYGTEYTKDTIISHTISNTQGCDSVINLILTINSSEVHSTSLTACDSTPWLGSTLYDSGIYQDTFQNVTGCDSIITLNLTISKATEQTFAVEDCRKYNWADTILHDSGIYSKLFSNIHGCDSLVHLDLTIKNVDDSVTQMGPSTLVAHDSMATSYIWMQCETNQQFTVLNGDTLQTFEANATGNYAVAIFKDGCRDTSDCALLYPLSVNEHSNEGLIVFPNPTKSTINVIVNGFRFDAILILYSIDGAVIRRIENVNRESELSLIGNPKGIYFLKVSDDDKSHWVRVILQ
ncbi:MAG: T9SS type A sorting domain-containing protein [Flavobacteriales bacterium]